MRANTQLPLALGPREAASFENFFSDDAEGLLAARRLAVDALEGGFEYSYLWGPSGSGKSHLLLAACRAASALGRTAGYASLADPAVVPGALDGLGRLDLVCVDDVSAAAGRAGWEAAVFRLYNELEGRGGRLLVASSSAPRGGGFALPDLVSRLSAGVVLRLRPPGEAARRALLRAGASARGFDLPEEVIAYLLARVPRDVPALVALLERLDASSLAERRRITVPFVRELLGERRGPAA